MAYSNSTYISGTKDGARKSYMPRGHWNPISAANYARRYGVSGVIEVEHCVFDASGHGRGGHDGRYSVSPKNIVTKLASWSEFGKEHT